MHDLFLYDYWQRPEQPNPFCHWSQTVGLCFFFMPHILVMFLMLLNITFIATNNILCNLLKDILCNIKIAKSNNSVEKNK